MTGIASRRVFIAAGGLFVLFGLSGKLSALISTIPSAVIGGVSLSYVGLSQWVDSKLLNKHKWGKKKCTLFQFQFY
ncbi:MAG: solute carrier family 23 protein [Carnobacterium sp.]